jgi:hypothetical protein
MNYFYGHVMRSYILLWTEGQTSPTSDPNERYVASEPPTHAEQASNHLSDPRNKQSSRRALLQLGLDIARASSSLIF